MFICNIKINKSKSLKIVLYLALVLVIIGLMVFLRSCIDNSKTVYTTDSTPYDDYIEISSANYTNILKDCNENLDKYLGKKIKFSGFVHRLYDFKDTQFVLGREMITSNLPNNQAEVVVVGFMCNCSSASSYKDKQWVEIEGTITKGNYHSEIPIIEVTCIKKVDCDKNPYVYPPDNTYV